MPEEKKELVRSVKVIWAGSPQIGSGCSEKCKKGSRGQGSKKTAGLAFTRGKNGCFERKIQASGTGRREGGYQKGCWKKQSWPNQKGGKKEKLIHVAEKRGNHPRK